MYGRPALVQPSEEGADRQVSCHYFQGNSGWVSGVILWRIFGMGEPSEDNPKQLSGELQRDQAWLEHKRIRTLT